MAGRPPSPKTFANMLRIAISEAHKEGGTKLRAVADALVEKAMTGDVPAIREIADRLDGKASQPITGPNGGPLQTIDLTKATDEQLATLETIFGPLAGPGDDDAGDPAGEGAT